MPEALVSCLYWGKGKYFEERHTVGEIVSNFVDKGQMDN
mgnify:FL=1